MPQGAADVAHVTAFWRKAGPDRWFNKDDAFDAQFRETCRHLHFEAARRRLDAWSDEAEGAFALMILLDQYPRNCFRGTAHMYATDPLARYFARKAVRLRLDQMVEPEVRFFFYLPFSHSENLSDQNLAVELFTPLGPDNLKHALRHREIVQRFGHFPHRNPMLGRETTPEEQAFLDGGGFAG